jgi:hypothetical protein
MKKSLHRNVLSCAASPLKLSELESSKQICYQVAASPLNMCALLLAEMITINKLSHKLNVSLHRNKRPSSPLPMHQTSSQSDKSSSPDEQMKDNKCALLLKMRPSSMKMLPLRNGSYGSMEMLSMQAQTNQSFSSSSQGFYSNPHEVRPPSPQEMRPSSLLQNSQVKNESPKIPLPSL